MRRTDMAEAARVSALAAIERGEMDAALVDLKRALDLSDGEWVHRPRVQADIEAIEVWQRERR
jgi:predicted Zn-dependent protease